MQVQRQGSKSVKKGNLIIKILFIIALCILGFFVSITFFTVPFQATNDAVAPFKGKFILAEKITYLLRQPKVGDGIISLPSTSSEVNYIGVIITVTDLNNIKTYQVMSKQGRPWFITQDKIKAKTYYPQVTAEQLQIIRDAMKTGSPSSKQSASCTYKGQLYPSGVSVPSSDTCNTCTCDNGQIACTMIACSTPGFTCPPGEYVDCMPGPNKGVRVECTTEFYNWAKTNCPNFKGAAL